MTVQPIKSKLITILVHVLVWVVFGIAIFFYHPLFSGIDIPKQAWITQGATLILLVLAFYINVAILVPRFLLHNQFVHYFASIIALVAAVVLINRWVAYVLETRHFFPGRIRPSPRMLIDRPTIIISALVLVIGTSLAVIRKWQNDKQAREELERDKVSSELSFLKAQINPHFFFNTLNNIYALTQSDAAEAGKAIHQLSRMMRYLLYDTQQGQTSVRQEIAFVKNYISLMQLRLTDVVKVALDVPVHIVDMPMAPMLLLPFVENAFKHGVSATRQSHIFIGVQQRDNQLEMTVKNSIMKDNSISLDTNSGIGLVNTRRRLDLLYPGKYTLDIDSQNAGNEYIVHLILDLT